MKENVAPSSHANVQTLSIPLTGMYKWFTRQQKSARSFCHAENGNFVSAILRMETLYDGTTMALWRTAHLWSVHVPLLTGGVGATEGSPEERRCRLLKTQRSLHRTSRRCVNHQQKMSLATQHAQPCAACLCEMKFHRARDSWTLRTATVILSVSRHALFLRNKHGSCIHVLNKAGCSGQMQTHTTHRA